VGEDRVVLCKPARSAAPLLDDGVASGQSSRIARAWWCAGELFPLPPERDRVENSRSDRD